MAERMSLFEAVTQAEDYVGSLPDCVDDYREWVGHDLASGYLDADKFMNQLSQVFSRQDLKRLMYECKLWKDKISLSPSFLEYSVDHSLVGPIKELSMEKLLREEF